MNKKYMPLFFAALLFGCAVGPDFEKPEYGQMPKSFDAENAPLFKAGEDGGDIEKWWKVFDDPLLNSLIERALEHNFDLNIARISVEQAGYQLGISQSGLFPVLDAKGGFAERGNMSGSSRGYTSAELGVGWEIDVFGGVRRGIESVEADYKAAEANKNAVRIKVASDVASAYFLYRFYCEDLSITRKNLETQEKTLKVIKERLENRLIAKLDYVRSEAQLRSTLSQIPSIEAQKESARYALELLLGLNSGALKEELKGVSGLPEFEKFVSVQVPAKLLERRPDIIEAEYKLHSAVAKIGEAEADFYPKFSITGNISYSAPAKANLFDSQYGSWSVGPTVSWNLFSAGKTYYNVKLQESLAKEAGVFWEKVVATAVKEVQEAMVSSVKQREKTEILKDVVKSNIDAYELSFKLFKAGELEFLDLLDVQRTMLAAEQSLLESRRQSLDNIILLYKSLGGGWQNNAENKD